ncbi:hypothetical protein WJX82_005421 [Trebouxia sp. C0006]
MLAVTSSLSSVSCYLAKCKTCTAVTCGIWQDHKSQLGTSQQEMATSHQGVIGQPAKCCGDVHWREPLNSVLKRSMERQPLVLPSRGVTTGGCPSMKLPSSIRWPGTDLIRAPPSGRSLYQHTTAEASVQHVHQHNMKFDLGTPNAGPQCSIKNHPSCMTGQINV